MRGSVKTEESENRDALHLSQRETNEGQREDWTERKKEEEISIRF